MTDLKSPNRLQLYARAVKRIFMWHTLSGRLPLYLVTEFPKSGGTWFSQMLSDCLDLPFRRNNLPAKIEKCVMHAANLHHRRYQNCTVVHRDGRDIMVSAYHHFLFRNEYNTNYGVTRTRKAVPCENYDDVYGNLPRFIEYMFDGYTKGILRFSWTQFIESWRDKQAAVVKYEELLADAAGTMRRVVQELTGETVSEERLAEIVDKYSFRRITGRNAGTAAKNTFARKGIAGDWKNNFSPEACEVFNRLAGKALIELGYETSDAWVHEQTVRMESKKAAPANEEPRSVAGAKA